MRKFWSTLVVVLMTASLAACGGDSGAFGTPATSSGATTATVAKLTLVSSAATVPADGTSVTITATAESASNVAVDGAVVTFAASAGTLAVTAGTTGTTGTATATLSASGVATGTVITITATAGGASAKTTVTVNTSTQTLTLSTSVPQISSNGASSATLKALVRDANNNVQKGVVVNFAVTSGTLVVTNPTGTGQGTTDATGTVIATLTAAPNPQNRDIIVTATAGSAPAATVSVTVIGTSLSISGPASLVLNTPGSYTVSLTDSGAAGIPNQTVNLTSALGNTVPATITTNAAGQAQFTLTPTVSGNDTITATALGQAYAEPITISSQSFAFTAPLPIPPAANEQIDIGTAASAVAVTVKWLSGTTPQAGKTINFAATRGTLSAPSAVTAADGTATVTIYSGSAGPATISAADQANTVSAQILVNFIATTPAAISMQASPTSVGLTDTSDITATIRDANNNLVPGQTVNFTLSDITQGSLSQATAITNAEGVASTTYKASTTASATNGVVITGTVQGVTPALTTTTSLTVGGQTVFLSLGTGNTIGVYSQTQYSQAYSVQAVDASGGGVPNIPITFTVKSLGYAKGYWTPNPGGTPAWMQVLRTAANDPDDYSLNGDNGCQSEDVNGNGILDVTTTSTEDYNGNGRLDPGLVVSTTEASGQSSTTGSDGSAAVTLIYPKDHARWVAVELTATATVNGTQNSATATYWLPILAADVADATVNPPGINSPYGQATTCLNPN
jgi:Bacterial Ig-like domain (group 1)